MKFSCDQCNAQYMIADEKVGERGVKVKCKKCSHVIVVKPSAAAEPAGNGAAEASAPTPAPASAGIGTGAFDSLFGGGAAGAPAAAAIAPSVPSEEGFGERTSMIPTGQLDALRQASFGGEASTAAAGAGFEGLSSGEMFAGAASASASAPQPSSRPAGAKEWYVAIDDAQIGPIDLAEIEQRWDAQELNEESLAWRAGMGDWGPIAEIPELAYLVNERPQAPKASTGSMAALAAGAGAGGLGTAAVANLTPMAFGGGGAAAGGDVAWKPSAASALSSLVQEELVHKEEAPKAARPAAPAGMPSMPGLPPMGGDLFGGGGNGGAAAFPTDFAAPAAGFSVPAPRPRSGGGIRPIHIVLTVLGLVLLAGLGGVIFFMLKMMQQQEPRLAQQQQVAAPPIGAIASPAPAPATAAADPGPEAGSERKSKGPRKSGEGGGGGGAGAGAGPARGGGDKRGKGDGLEDLFDDKKGGGGGGGGKPDVEKLSRDDIMNGIKSNAGSLLPCLQGARSRGEMVPGPIKLVLDWDIKPNGSVQEGALKGPANVMGTSLPGCFAAAMRKWKFPSSREGAPVKNFPLPLTVK